MKSVLYLQVSHSGNLSTYTNKVIFIKIMLHNEGLLVCQLNCTEASDRRADGHLIIVRI